MRLTSPFLSLSFSLSHPLHSLSFLFEDAGRIYSFHSQFSVFSFPTVWGCIVGSALLPVANFKHISSRRLTLSAHICCLLPAATACCTLHAATAIMLPVGWWCPINDSSLPCNPLPPHTHAHRQMDSWGNQQQQIISTVLGSLHCSKKRKTFRFQLQQANTCCKNRNFRWGARWHMGHAQETIEVLQVQVAAKQVS